LALALISVGALRTSEERARLVEWDRLKLPAREARLEICIERVFASVEPGRPCGIARIVAAEPHLRDLTGQRIYFAVTNAEGHSQDFLRGAIFSGLGLLERLPFLPPPTDFNRLLADEGANFSFSRIHLEGALKPAGPLVRFCDDAGTRMETILRTGLDHQSSAADLYVAMLLGKKEYISPQQKDWFIRSGTMHLFAISGLHIAGIAAAITTLLTLARVPGWIRFVCGTILLWIYVQITGGAASAVRAWWMVTCLHAAFQFRLPGSSLAALVASALAMLVVTPHQLFSAGFQMSYGIVAAILLYGVPLQEKWLTAWQPLANLPKELRRVRHTVLEKIGRGILAAIAMGLAATLVSTPASISFFGLISPGGFFVNLLLIPASAPVLFSGVASLIIGGLGFTTGADIFNHSAALVLIVMEATVEWSLQLSASSLPAEFVTTTLAAWSSALMLAVLAVGYATGWTRRIGGYWIAYVALALLLALGTQTPD
jgi:competence protein ComEC